MESFSRTKTICEINSHFLIISDKPVMVSSPLTSRSATEPHEPVDLVCEADGVPNVTFTWAKVTKEGENNKGEVIREGEERFEGRYR